MFVRLQNEEFVKEKYFIVNYMFFIRRFLWLDIECHLQDGFIWSHSKSESPDFHCIDLVPLIRAIQFSACFTIKLEIPIKIRATNHSSEFYMSILHRTYSNRIHQTWHVSSRRIFTAFRINRGVLRSIPIFVSLLASRLCLLWYSQ